MKVWLWVRISSNTRWKWFQSHARIDFCAQSWLSHEIKRTKIQVAKWGTPKNFKKSNKVTLFWHFPDPFPLCDN